MNIHYSSPTDAPEFYDKPKIVQRDNGNVISIKIRAKSHLELKAEWFKVCILVKTSTCSIFSFKTYKSVFV